MRGVDKTQRNTIISGFTLRSVFVKAIMGVRYSPIYKYYELLLLRHTNKTSLHVSLALYYIELQDYSLEQIALVVFQALLLSHSCFSR